MRERVCDHCSHRQIDQYLNEYEQPVSDLLIGTVTKPNQDYGEEKMFTCDCGAPFKTDEELFKDPQSEHGR